SCCQSSLSSSASSSSSCACSRSSRSGPTTSHSRNRRTWSARSSRKTLTGNRRRTGDPPSEPGDSPPLMCGICGVAGGDPADGRDLIRRMCAAMVHRGPDDEGGVHLDGVTLGMRRLSIIDLAGGHQPMHNEDSTVWVVQNGEILNGMFAFALLDRRRSLVVLARDRVGIKPLHYAVESGRLVFASELKALLRDPALRKGVDPVALDEYLAHEFVPSPRSIVRG